MSRALITEHELAALRLLAQGRTQVEIARTLRIRPETVGRLLNRARILLRARTLPHAVARGYETGLLGPPPHDHGAGQEEHRPSGPDGPNRGQEPTD
ncbi:helix-turn-helix transcriptional regulator [Streptomyces microflavus]|uniref:helix-turn-helix transcriptional regulator n=1 Tax=Streptomyces microflavus TaxID=1919 RepID=UPI003319F6C0